MSLCAPCSNSALLRSPWEKLQPIGEEPKVVHSWKKTESSPGCALCQLVENEIRAVGRFEEESSRLMRFIQLYLQLDGLIDHAPTIEELNLLPGQDLPIPDNARHDGPAPQHSHVPIAAPRPSSGQDGPERVRDGFTASLDSEQRNRSSQTDAQSPKKTQDASNADRSGPNGSLEASLWDQASNLIPSKEDSNAIVDQDILVRTMALMQKTFSEHRGSENCVLCNSMKDLSASGELDLDRLKYNFEGATQSEKELAVSNHVPPPDPRTQLRLSHRWAPIEKVDFVLEKRENWSAIRLQEFRRDEKALRFGPRRTLLNTSLDLSDRSQTSQPVTEEPGDQPRSDFQSALLDFGRSTEAAPELALKKEYRQHAKDVCVLVPLRKGKHGSAREVRGRVDVDTIKLWLSRCEDKHSICSRRNEDPYPPGLILIDADKMCLAPVAPHDPVRYIALSYVWGYVAQPTLTKAVLERWMSDGQLRDLDVPQTIRDAIHLVRMIGYRFIWVDALCIVQDDAASRHGQISQMHEIYRHADMTIVAADGDSCSEGLPGVTLGKDRAYKHRRYELPGLSLMKVPSSTKHGIEMSPWRTRGWTFQEEICSRRTLVLLPEVMFFSCASGVWREDVQLEAEKTLTRSEEGLISLASMLHGKSADDGEDLLLLFRELVKKYMQRTLSRTDDMENAFAGVAGMLEPLIGPAYHGIPERMFGEVIQGCWFWDTSLQRRAGFPSWSWTGWIYRREQADIGIQPLSTGATISKLLAFYKPESSSTKLLGKEDVAAYSCGDYLPRMDVELRTHFLPDEEAIKSKNESLKCQAIVPGNLIAFYTSIAQLRLRTPPGDFVGSSREYRVFHPHTNRQLTSIRLSVAHVAQKGTLLPFIVVGHDPDRQSFRLMLISMEGSTAERVNVTSQSRLVREDDWKGASPKRELIFMS